VEEKLTRIEAMLRLMSSSRNPADRKLFLEYAFGKPKEELDVTSGGEKITPATFEKEENREQYYPILVECLKVNLAPFFKGLGFIFSRGFSLTNLFTPKQA